MKAPEDLADAWRAFTEILKCYGNAPASLNEPCSAEKIREVEREMKLELPADLVELLKLCNGQKPDTRGVFKSVSGWDVYRRQIFLDVESIPAAYAAFLRDEVLVQEFGDQEIPFAAARSAHGYEEIFSVHRETQRVSLIWTEISDPFLPPEWQLTRFDRGEDLEDFLRWQIKLYW